MMYSPVKLSGRHTVSGYKAVLPATSNKLHQESAHGSVFVYGQQNGMAGKVNKY